MPSWLAGRTPEQGTLLLSQLPERSVAILLSIILLSMHSLSAALSTGVAHAFHAVALMQMSGRPCSDRFALPFRQECGDTGVTTPAALERIETPNPGTTRQGFLLFQWAKVPGYGVDLSFFYFFFFLFLFKPQETWLPSFSLKDYVVKAIVTQLWWLPKDSHL